MAKKKNAEPIVGTGKAAELLTVQKSRPLFGLWKSDYTLASFKIMDAYLARINSKKPEKRTVVFEKGEIEKLLGVTKINKPDLKNRLKNLQQPVDLAKNNSKKIQSVTLFEEATAEQDDDGIWQVTLTCTPSAMKYFFNIENIGYLRYRLRSIVNITSRYSYIMFTYLESNRYRKSWEVELEELKEILNCQDDELYKEFKRLNERILKKCHKELTEKTELRYDYKSVKKGRKVVAIRFTVETIKDLIEQDNDQIEGQMTVSDWQQSYDDLISFLRGACADEFSSTQMEAVLEIIQPKELPPHINDSAESSDNRFAKYHYLQKQYKLLNVEAERKAKSKKPIQNRFKYFQAMLEKDCGE